MPNPALQLRRADLERKRIWQLWKRLNCLLNEFQAKAGWNCVIAATPPPQRAMLRLRLANKRTHYSTR
jgi:hypothetical protein